MARDGSLLAHRLVRSATFLLLAAMMLLTACGGPWRDKYLEKGLNNLTQDQVAEKLGPPHTLKTPALGGDTIWTYRVPMGDKEIHPWNPSNLTAGPKTKAPPSPSPFGKSLAGSEEAYREPLYCYRYTLAFDEAKVLKSWKREECVPRSGGEGSATP
ncbi:MAG: hypothetical protein KF814_11585 [Nitrospiraceae bacterium]|nr:hypothetical protein [Nitrospiraceae bacterium]